MKVCKSMKRLQLLREYQHVVVKLLGIVVFHMKKKREKNAVDMNWTNKKSWQSGTCGIWFEI